jgi:hypothetical protein
MSMQVSGTLQSGEAQSTAQVVAARLRGSAGSYYLIFAAIIMICGALGAAFAKYALRADPEPGVFFGVMLSFIVYVRAARALTLRRFRRRLVDAGLPLTYPMSVTLEADALVYEVGGVREIVRWDVVTDLFRTRGYLIFLAQAHGIYVPERFFATAADERAFITQALTHMTPKAQARSLDVQLFAEGVPRPA